jgi:hypothetical protein
MKRIGLIGGLLIGEGDAPWPAVDSTVAHVKALLNH